MTTDTGLEHTARSPQGVLGGQSEDNSTVVKNWFCKTPDLKREVTGWVQGTALFLSLRLSFLA